MISELWTFASNYACNMFENWKSYLIACLLRLVYVLVLVCVGGLIPTDFIELN